MDALSRLSELISKFPGIGPKSSRRIASFILKSDSKYTAELSGLISQIKDLVRPCKVCGCWCSGDLCDICSDESRDRSKICVIENPDDLQSFESSKIYKGLYHVLGGRISPLSGIYPEDLTFDKLKDRVTDGSKYEIIIATNPNEEGETTAYYIKKMLSGYDNLTFTRPAIGLASGANIEYATQMSIAQSIINRKEI